MQYYYLVSHIPRIHRPVLESNSPCYNCGIPTYAHMKYTATVMMLHLQT